MDNEQNNDWLCMAMLKTRLILLENLPDECRLSDNEVRRIAFAVVESFKSSSNHVLLTKENVLDVYDAFLALFMYGHSEMHQDDEKLANVLFKAVQHGVSSVADERV